MQEAEVGVQSQQQGATWGARSLAVSSCKVGTGQPAGPAVGAGGGHYSPISSSFSLQASQPDLPVSSTNSKRTGFGHLLPTQRGSALVSWLEGGGRAQSSSSHPPPATSAALSSPREQPSSVASCKTVAARYRRYLLSSSFLLLKKKIRKKFIKTCSVNSKPAHIEYECFYFFLRVLYMIIY